MKKSSKTPLRYPGGKSRAIKFLFSEENLPRNISEYREPFLGGGSCAIAFTKLYPEIPVWVNDKYYPLYCFWNQLQSNGSRLHESIMESKLNSRSATTRRELFLWAKDTISDQTCEFEIARRFYILNKCSFSGLGESSGFSDSASLSNFSINNINTLPSYSKLIKNWRITNLQYSQLMGEDCPTNTFLFLDPPYDINSFLYGKKGNMHSTFDHKLFKEDVYNTSGNVMVTYNSNDVIKEMYTDMYQTEWDLTYTMHSSKVYRKYESNRKELLIKNYTETKEAILEGF